MVDVDLSLDGASELQASFEELEARAEDPDTFVVGTNTEYAVYLEFGTRKMQPYPFFRPAINQFKANPKDFITDNTGYTDIEEIPTADALVEAVAAALQTKMEANASADSSAMRSPGTDPSHPKRDTGNLVASINATRVS